MKSSKSTRYSTNLIRTLRDEEKKSEQRERLTVIFAIGSFAFLLLAVLYSVLYYLSMRNVLKVEEQNLSRLQSEFRKYAVSSEVIEKNDVELLNGLQLNSIFWSKQLSALGQYLPEGYWLKSIHFSGKTLKVSGFAAKSDDQMELVRLQYYLQKLERDSVFRQHFKEVRLSQARRNSDAQQSGLTFEFLAENNQKLKK